MDRLSQGTGGGMIKIYHETSGFMNPVTSVREMVFQNPVGTVEQLDQAATEFTSLVSATRPQRDALVAAARTAKTRVADFQKEVSRRIEEVRDRYGKVMNDRIKIDGRTYHSTRAGASPEGRQEVFDAFQKVVSETEAKFKPMTPLSELSPGEKLRQNVAKAVAKTGVSEEVVRANAGIKLDEERVMYAQRTLNEKFGKSVGEIQLSQAEEAGIIKAHESGQAIYENSLGDIRKKRQILGAAFEPRRAQRERALVASGVPAEKAAQQSKEEMQDIIRILQEHGYVGMPEGATAVTSGAKPVATSPLPQFTVDAANSASTEATWFVTQPLSFKYGGGFRTHAMKPSAKESGKFNMSGDFSFKPTVDAAFRPSPDGIVTITNHDRQFMMGREPQFTIRNPTLNADLARMQEISASPRIANPSEVESLKKKIEAQMAGVFKNDVAESMRYGGKPPAPKAVAAVPASPPPPPPPPPTPAPPATVELPSALALGHAKRAEIGESLMGIEPRNFLTPQAMVSPATGKVVGSEQRFALPHSGGRRDWGLELVDAPSGLVKVNVYSPVRSADPVGSFVVSDPVLANALADFKALRTKDARAVEALNEQIAKSMKGSVETTALGRKSVELPAQGFALASPKVAPPAPGTVSNAFHVSGDEPVVLAKGNWHDLSSIDNAFSESRSGASFTGAARVNDDLWFGGRQAPSKPGISGTLYGMNNSRIGNRDVNDWVAVREARRTQVKAWVEKVKDSWTSRPAGTPADKIPPKFRFVNGSIRDPKTMHDYMSMLTVRGTGTTMYIRLPGQDGSTREVVLTLSLATANRMGPQYGTRFKKLTNILETNPRAADTDPNVAAELLEFIKLRMDLLQ